MLRCTLTDSLPGQGSWIYFGAVVTVNIIIIIIIIIVIFTIIIPLHDLMAWIHVI